MVEMVNLEGEVFTKQGVSNRTFSLATFFRSGSDGISDPKIIFDAPSGRWFSSLVDITTHNILLAVSSSSDPTGFWVFYSLSAGSVLPDQPILGISDDKVALAANDFSGNTFAGAQFWILNKSELLAGAATAFFTPGANRGEFSIHPVQSLSSTTTQFMVSNIVVHGALSTTSLRLFSVTGGPGVSMVSVVTTDLAVSTIGTVGGTLPGGVQAGTSSIVNTNDFRVEDSVWYKSMLWLGFNDACTPAGDTQGRSCIRLVKIITTSPASVSQDFDFGANSQYYYYPALRLDNRSNLFVVYGYSNATVYPRIAVTGQLATDPPNSLAPPSNLKLGNAADTSTRYGDYFGAGLDPADPATVWVAGEYHNITTGSCQSFGSCWSTFIGSTTTISLTLSANPSSVTMSCTYFAGCDPGNTMTSTLTIKSLNGFSGTATLTYSVNRFGGPILTGPTSATVSSGGSTNVTMTVRAAGTTAGNYYWTVSGSDGGFTASTTFTVVFYYCRDCV